MKNLTNSTSYQNHVCTLCNDTGIITELEWIESDLVDKHGKPIMVERIKVDPNTGYPPLCECHKRKIFEKYNASAGMKPNERTRYFKSATIDDENRHAFMQGKNFIDHIHHHKEQGSWLYIYGDEQRACRHGKSAFGTGKSYLTHCIGNELTLLGEKSIYVTEDKLFEEIKQTYRKDSEESESAVLYRYQNVPILLIDDLFKSKTSDWSEDKLFHLLNNRMKPGMVTIINSNYAPNRLTEQMPKTGGAISSRILGQSILIEMIGRDRRRPSRKDESA